MKSIHVLLVACVIAASQGGMVKELRLGGPNPNTMSFTCLLEHCAGQMAKAFIDVKFMEEAKCEMGCNPIYYNDTSPGKLHYQNCTTKCALTYESPAGSDFLNCGMQNNCVQFAKINGTCPFPEVDPESSLGSLFGEWWQHYGHNSLWDCYPCQHIHTMRQVNNASWCAQTVGPNGAVQAPCWAYNYSYDLYTETGTRYFGQVWQLPGDIPKGKPIDIYYSYMGSTHNETWYILKATSRYVLLVDCSYMSGWTNVGSIVWVRPDIVLTPDELSEISAVYKVKLGWDFSQFCVDRHGYSKCDGPPALGSTNDVRQLLRANPMLKYFIN